MILLGDRENWHGRRRSDCRFFVILVIIESNMACRGEFPCNDNRRQLRRGGGKRRARPGDAPAQCVGRGEAVAEDQAAQKHAVKAGQSRGQKVRESGESARAPPENDPHQTEPGLKQRVKLKDAGPDGGAQRLLPAIPERRNTRLLRAPPETRRKSSASAASWRAGAISRQAIASTRPVSLRALRSEGSPGSPGGSPKDRWPKGGE